MSEADSRQIKIAIIPGDGIGQEVVPEGIRVLDRLAELSSGGFSFGTAQCSTRYRKSDGHTTHAAWYVR